MNNNTDYTEGNKLIAEFMGWQYGGTRRLFFWGKKRVFYKNDAFKNRHPYIKAFDYDNNWDCLMPVIEKIKSLGYCVSIRFEAEDGFVNPYHECGISKTSGATMFSSIYGENCLRIVYNTVIQFITWYNQQNKPNGK